MCRSGINDFSEKIGTLLSGKIQFTPDGMSVSDAVIEAAVSRCRQTLLMSVTIFAGLTPLLLNQSVPAGVLTPMAISLAWGGMLATVVNLWVVPAGYLILEKGSARRSAPSTHRLIELWGSRMPEYRH